MLLLLVLMVLPVLMLLMLVLLGLLLLLARLVTSVGAIPNLIKCRNTTNCCTVDLHWLLLLLLLRVRPS
jgi:hypothetical protein